MACDWENIKPPLSVSLLSGLCLGERERESFLQESLCTSAGVRGCGWILFLLAPAAATDSSSSSSSVADPPMEGDLGMFGSGGVPGTTR